MFKKGFSLFAVIISMVCMIPASLYATSAKPVVVILATGGTIAGSGVSEVTTIGYKAAVFKVDQLIAAVPSLKNIAEVRGEQIFQIASENITPDHWLKLAKRVNAVLAQTDVSGVVITHGTDTLEETAYFLNLTVKSDKPVVVVGSMRPATAISADGPINLYNGVAIAASPASRGKGVLVTLNDRISSAREVTKSNTFTADTFKSPDIGELGYIQLGTPLFYRLPLRRHTLASEFDLSKIEKLPIVEIYYGFGGSGRDVIDRTVASGTHGIVYAGTGNGSLSDSAKTGLADSVKKGLSVVRSSRTGSGVVTRNGEVQDDDYGFVTADNLSPQKARILLMLGMTVTRDPQKLQEMFERY